MYCIHVNHILLAPLKDSVLHVNIDSIVGIRLYSQWVAQGSMFIISVSRIQFNYFQLAFFTLRNV